MKKVEAGSVVKLCYKGRFEGAEEAVRDRECQQVEIEVGSGKVMKGFEEALIGMGANEKKSFTLSPDEAYGQRDDRLEKTFERSELPDDFGVQPGEVVALQTSKGDQIFATVLKMEGNQITLDFNHPLAGKFVTFDVEIEEIH